MIPSPALLDVTECSALIGCACHWRTVTRTEDEARLLYAEHRRTEHPPEQATATTCQNCGSSGDLLPRRGICQPCHRADRAARARARYHRENVPA